MLSKFWTEDKNMKPQMNKISNFRWEIPVSTNPDMRVPARIYASEKLLNEMDEGVFRQIMNVACLPGIRRYAICMPDAHRGYGFPIGGIAAFSPVDCQGSHKTRPISIA